MKRIGFEPDLEWRLDQYTFNVLDIFGAINRDIVEFSIHKGKAGQKPEIKVFPKFHIGDHGDIEPGSAIAFGNLKAVIENKTLQVRDMEIGAVVSKGQPKVIGFFLKLPEIMVAPAVLRRPGHSCQAESKEDYGL